MLFRSRIIERVIQPTLDGMAAEGAPFTGFLYAGLMIDADGNPLVIEFNVRMGDPETQPLLMRLQSDLVELIEAALDGRLDRVQARWNPRPALGVVLCAGGYPGSVRKGDPIEGLDAAAGNDLKLFHAGTRQRADGAVETAGGRVLCACALGDDFRNARDRAYALAAQVRFEGGFMRRDIGHHALQGER